MTYVVTARKWRPKRFDEVVGQEHITTTLKNAINNNRIAHAYLFTGPRGVGKTTTARILAKVLNCLNPQEGEPCNECEMCLSIQSSQSMDIIEIDGASNRGIDEIRTLRDSVKYAPTKGKYKVYIIDEVHMLTRESFNAFLKTLEEPPSQTIFIFATTDVHKVPLTIISRCQRFDFRRIQLELIKSLIKKIADAEKIKIDDKSLTIIAKKADGALRDAESYFDQVVSFCGDKIDSETVSRLLNLVSDDIYFKISDAVLEKNFKSVFEVSDLIYKNGWNFIDFADGLVEHFRNILSVIVTGNADILETADSNKPLYMNYIGNFSEGDLLRLLNYLNKTQQELRYAQNQKLKIEIALTHLIGLERSSTLSEIISQLSSSEGKVDNLTDTSVAKEDSRNYRKPENPPSQEKKTSNGIEPNQAKEQEQNISSESKLKVGKGLGSVINQWDTFIKEIENERQLLLGPFLQSIKPGNILGNRLEIICFDKDSKNAINTHMDYFEKKAKEIFGKQLKFKLIESENAPSDHSPDQNAVPQHKSTHKAVNSAETDPYKKAIIEELGGKEIG